jgi:hypothetical protein
MTFLRQVRTLRTVQHVNPTLTAFSRIRAKGRELKERFGILRVGVFGSFADGEQTDSSDVDLLVDMPEPGGFLFIEAAQHMEDLLGREVDFVREEGLNPRLKSRVLKDAVYVWTA